MSRMGLFQGTIRGRPGPEVKNLDLAGHPDDLSLKVNVLPLDHHYFACSHSGVDRTAGHRVKIP